LVKFSALKEKKLTDSLEDMVKIFEKYEKSNLVFFVAITSIKLKALLSWN
jgi:hypothetical protein